MPPSMALFASIATARAATAPADTIKNLFTPHYNIPCPFFANWGRVGSKLFNWTVCFITASSAMVRIGSHVKDACTNYPKH